MSRSYLTTSPPPPQCDICCDEYPPGETQASTACQHRFCVHCWESYLGVRIRGGDAHHILCPAHDCSFLVPLELIEKLVSREMASRYLQFDIKVRVGGGGEERDRGEQRKARRREIELVCMG